MVVGVDLILRSGEIHAITGENGAGKSSLAKAIAGVYRPRLGTIFLNDLPVTFRGPREALKAGVALIHQEPLTFPDLDVAESIFAGNLIRKGPFVDWASCRQRAQELLETLGIHIDTRAKMGALSVAKRQLVELASALAHDAKVWIFDETTAPLTPKEVSDLFRVMRALRDQGCALAMVSHHLHEVFEIADTITVLRDGSKVGERKTSETKPDEIVKMMVGRELSGERLTLNEPQGQAILEVQSFCGPGFKNIGLHLRQGEIVGIAGLVGAGRTEFARALFGIVQPSSGSLSMDGQPLKVRSPQGAMKARIA